MTLRDGQVHESVTETPSSDGVRNYRVVSSPVLDKDGRVTAAIEMVDDITEHLRAQQAVADSEARYRTIFETTGTATMIVEEDMTISMVNAEFVKESGFSKAEIEGRRRWTEFIHEDDLEQMKAYHVQRRIDPESVPRSYEVRFRDGGGRIRNVTMTVSLIPGTKKSVASLMDITVRKQAEERIKESERFLADVINFLPDATFVIDGDGKVIAWNRAIEEMTGIPAPEMIGKGNYEHAIPFYGERRPILIDLALKPDRRYEGTYVSTERGETVLIGEAYMPALKGGDVYLHGTASVLRDSAGNVIGAIESIRDITERRRMEEALRRREEDLEVKSRNLEEMNTALRVLLKHREEDKSELEEKILSNVKKLVVPYVEKLRKSRLSDEQASYVEILDDHLQDILSPFLRNLGTRHLNLTPKEIQVASLIREGKTSKDIAEVLGVSARAVDFPPRQHPDQAGYQEQEGKFEILPALLILRVQGRCATPFFTQTLGHLDTQALLLCSLRPQGCNPPSMQRNKKIQVLPDNIPFLIRYCLFCRFRLLASSVQRSAMVSAEGMNRRETLHLRGPGNATSRMTRKCRFCGVRT